MDLNTIISAVSQIGFPVVLFLATIFWIGKYGLPKIASLIEKIVDDFKDEMEKERTHNRENINRFFDEANSKYGEIKGHITRETDRVIEVCKRHPEG
jgi:hypothetical protein